jgi:hypothetical protein
VATAPHWAPKSTKITPPTKTLPTATPAKTAAAPPATTTKPPPPPKPDPAAFP